jgi:eukaryotic-like serine/threonine-protein kinase
MRFSSKDAVRSTAAVPPAAAKIETRPEPERQAPAAAPTAMAEPPAIEAPTPVLQRPLPPTESNVSSRRAPLPARRPTPPGSAPKTAPAPSEAAGIRSQPTPSEGAGTRSQASASTPAVDPGYLSFDSMPWSEVYLGNKHLGTTPLIRVALPPGRHVLTLKNPEVGTSTSYVVEIAPGKSVSRFVGWEKE